MAYVWLLINALTGLPVWPNVDRPGYLAVDALVWSILNLFVHGAAMFQVRRRRTAACHPPAALGAAQPGRPPAGSLVHAPRAYSCLSFVPALGALAPTRRPAHPSPTPCPLPCS